MRRPIVLLFLVMIALLGAMAAKGLLVQPPPLRSQNSAGEFDAVRAKARLTAILGDQRPHPTDTDASDLVRARLIAQLRQMGLQPIIRDQFACNELYKQRGVACAHVRNVVVQLSDGEGKALLLNAHYDSTPVGPGAADDGAGVATQLEIAKVLPGEILFARPIILLFNEGEELGLVGARAFLADPLSRNVDSVINLEARGVSGPVNMFETSRPNAAPIAVYKSAVDHPVANSLSTDVYRLLPNYTDVNSFAERGWLTLNLAPIGNETRYHSAGDDIAALDPATLQHMGDQTLELTAKLNFGTPKAVGGDRVFMDVAGRALITLTLSLGIVLLVGQLLAFAFVSLSRGGLGQGLAVAIGTFVGSAALAWLALAAIGAVRHGMFWRAEPVWTHLATYATVILIGGLALSTVGRATEVHQLRAAFWLFFLALGAIIGLIAPGGIIFFLFPPLLALIGMVAVRWWKPAEAIGSAAAIVVLYVTWGAMLGLLEELLNGGPIWVFGPLGSLLLLPAMIEAKPLFDRTDLTGTATAAGLLTLLGWGAALAAPAYSADRQQRFVIQHVTDASAHKSWWSVLNDGAPVPYSGKWKRGELPFSDRPRWFAPATANPEAKPPEVQLISEVKAGNQRTLALRLAANGNERIELIAPSDAKIRTAGVAGFVRPINQSEEGKYFIDCFGRSCDGVTLQLTTDQLKPIKFLVLGSKARLPTSAAPLLAGGPKFARPQYNRDESIVFATRIL
jgi:hypothetical protein